MLNTPNQERADNYAMQHRLRFDLLWHPQVPIEVCYAQFMTGPMNKSNSSSAASTITSIATWIYAGELAGLGG
jgi:hypothetical protein